MDWLKIVIGLLCVVQVLAYAREAQLDKRIDRVEASVAAQRGSCR